MTIQGPSKRIKIEPLELTGLYPSGSRIHPSTPLKVMRYAFNTNDRMVRLGADTVKTVDIGRFKTLRHAMFYAFNDVFIHSSSLRGVLTAQPEYTFKIETIDGEIGEMDERDFVHIDRRIARGEGFPGSAAIVEARRPGFSRPKNSAHERSILSRSVI